MWVTKDKNSDCFEVWKNKPIRDMQYECWMNEDHSIDDSFQISEVDFNFYPVSWEDEPVEVSLEKIYRQKCRCCEEEFIFKRSDIIEIDKPEEEFYFHYVECPKCGNKCNILDNYGFEEQV